MLNHGFQRIPAVLLLMLGLAVLTVVGCSDNPIEPEISAEAAQRNSGSLRSEGDGTDPRGDDPSYFPLHDGDLWIYVVTGPSGDEKGGGIGSPMAEVRVRGSRRMGDLRVYELESYLFPISDRPVQFYNESPGRTMELADRSSGLWYPWWLFAYVVETPILLPDFHDDCVHGSRGTYFGSPSTVTVPAGTFAQSATIHYFDTPCVDAGFLRETLAPEVGLIERTVTTLQGEVTWSLAYAVVGGQTWGAPPLGSTESGGE